MALPIPSKPLGTPYGRKCCRIENGKKTPHYWSNHTHKGVDQAAPTGTPVFAVVGGTITAAKWGAAFGNHFVIDQDALNDGTPQRIAGYWATYGHLSRVDVKVGQKVAKGQQIGLVGTSGNVSGAHVHYEVRSKLDYSAGLPVDPTPYLKA